MRPRSWALSPGPAPPRHYSALRSHHHRKRRHHYSTGSGFSSSSSSSSSLLNPPKDDDDFASRMRQGMEEVKQARQSQKYYFDVSLQGLLGAIQEGGTGGVSDAGDSNLFHCRNEPKEKPATRSISTAIDERFSSTADHVAKCLSTLPTWQYDCTQVPDHPTLQSQGATLLHFAAAHGNLEACRFLLRHQSSGSKWSDALGAMLCLGRLSPLGVAILRGHFSIARYFWYALRRTLNWKYEVDCLLHANAPIENLFWLWKLETGSQYDCKRLVRLFSRHKRISELIADDPVHRWEIDTSELMDHVAVAVCDRPSILHSLAESGLFDSCGSESLRRCLKVIAQAVCNNAAVENECLRALRTLSALQARFFHADPFLNSQNLLLAVLQKNITRLNESRIMKVIDFLITRCGSDVNATDESQRSVLFIVVAIGRLPAIEALLRHGADPNIATKEGYLPLDFTHSARPRFSWDWKKKVRSLLYEHGASRHHRYRMIPVSGDGKSNCEIKRSLSSLGMIRKVSRIDGQPGKVHSSLLCAFTPNVTLELGSVTSSRTFDDKVDHALYESAHFSTIIVRGKCQSTGWRRCGVALRKFGANWLRTQETKRTRQFAEQAADFDQGHYTVRIRPCSYDEGSTGWNAVQLFYRSNWKPEVEEAVPFPRDSLRYNGKYRNFVHLGDDNSTLYVKLVIPQILDDAVANHISSESKKILDEAATDLALQAQHVRSIENELGF